jgi:hypothetical protein
VVYIPSDTKVYLSDGVLIENANSTYTPALKATKTVFHFCDPSKAGDASGSSIGDYENGYRGYNGVHNSALLGYGNATIDMMGVSDRYGALMVHANDILVQGVTFKGIMNGHGLEVNASANVNIKNCTFTGSTLATSKSDEGVNIDSADFETAGINVPYSSYDLTACSDITIQGCTFSDLPRAIGTHTYSYGHPHLRIRVVGNTIGNTFRSAIGTMYWQDSLIQGNTIDGVGNKRYGISGEGTINLTVVKNTFANMFRIAEFFVWEEDYYPEIAPDMPDAALNQILNSNSFVNVTNRDIRMEPDYGTEEYFFPPGPIPDQE